MTAGVVELLGQDPLGGVLVGAVLDGPDECLTGQAFADWLEESGVPGVELIRGSFAEEVFPPAELLAAWLGDAVPGRVRFMLHQGVLRAALKGSQGWYSLPSVLR